jgi:uncharacterized membrane-anchored protein
VEIYNPLVELPVAHLEALNKLREDSDFKVYIEFLAVLGRARRDALVQSSAEQHDFIRGRILGLNEALTLIPTILKQSDRIANIRKKKEEDRARQRSGPVEQRHLGNPHFWGPRGSGNNH